MKNYKEFLNESKESGLVVIPSTDNDFKKLVSWLKTSDYYAEIFTREKYLFFDERNTESLEKELEKEFIKKGISVRYELQENLSNSFISSDANKIAAYSDMDAKDRKALDDYCMDEYGLPFMGVGFEEQSTARSVIWAKKEDPESIEKQNIIDSNL